MNSDEKPGGPGVRLVRRDIYSTGNGWQCSTSGRPRHDASARLHPRLPVLTLKPGRFPHGAVE